MSQSSMTATIPWELLPKKEEIEKNVYLYKTHHSISPKPNKTTFGQN